MIKSQDGVFYLTAGETCYIFRADGDGRISHVHFGKRVEFEDDLAALDCAAVGTAEIAFGGITRGGKPLSTDFVLQDAKVLDVKPVLDRPMLGGGKTLVTTLHDGEAQLTLELYITPYTRGGFGKRVVLINEGKASVTVAADFMCCALADAKDFVTVSADGAVNRTSERVSPADNGLANFIAVAESDASETFGGVYGFMCVYGDGSVGAERTGNVTVVGCRDKDNITLKSGERYCTPEVIAVYSDSGIGGMSRVFHDILREHAVGGKATSRKPTVLFCPTLDGKKLCDAAVAATELGCDVFAVNGGEVGLKALGDISATCKSAGIKLGITVSPDRIEKSSALYSSDCVATDDKNVFAASFCDGIAESKFAANLENVIAATDAEYIMIDIPRGGVKPFALGMCRLRNRLAERFADAVIEWGAVKPELRYGNSMCYPSCIVRNTVTAEPASSFKARFDGATFGCLGYSLDPLSLGAELKRAVRAQILSYQDDAPRVMEGDLYRLSTPDGVVGSMAVTKDKSKAYVVCMRSADTDSRIKLVGLDAHNLYRVRELDKIFSGAALISCGVAVAKAQGGDKTLVLHIRQVADYDN